LAQIRGRNALPWDDRLACDVWYVDHRSMQLDLSILARTVALVVRGIGIDHEAGVTMTEFRGRRA
jgi:lipopolysaccharide/colanic/teichoic acid biosynthesis glycosyltransferase